MGGGPEAPVEGGVDEIMPEGLLRRRNEGMKGLRNDGMTDDKETIQPAK